MRVRVFLHHLGTRIPVGILAQTEQGILFEYRPDFLERGIPLSPYFLPLRPGTFFDDKQTLTAFSVCSTTAFPTAGACFCSTGHWHDRGVPSRRPARWNA